MDTNKPQRYSDITPDMIRDWKAKYGEFALSEVSVPLNPNRAGEEKEVNAQFVLRVPNRITTMAISEQIGDQKSADLLLENTVLGGDMAALDQYAFVWGEVVSQATKLMTSSGSAIKKL